MAGMILTRRVRKYGESACEASERQTPRGACLHVETDVNRIWLIETGHLLHQAAQAIDARMIEIAIFVGAASLRNRIESAGDDNADAFSDAFGLAFDLHDVVIVRRALDGVV